MKTSYLWISTLLMLFALQANAQTKLSWTTLAKLTFEAKGSESGEVPVFGEELKALDGELVLIEGFMLPLTVDNNRFVLSRYPFYNCYFCGNAGRETVIELKPIEEDWEFDIDDQVKIQGKLKLVADEEGLIFELLEAKELK
ncbi:MAG: DUF3299 domain-containing protein [Bacteroidota bacterium]